MMPIRQQQGVTLIELMIGLLVGAVITGGVINIYNNTLKSSTENLNLARLNQDLRAMMDLMVRDMRRAGYVTDQPEANDGNGDGINDDLTSNPFFDSNQPGATTDLMVLDGNCILYSYNRDNDTPATVAANKFLGFKLQDQQLRMRMSGATTDDCNDGAWENITEPEVEIPGLTFNLTETVYNPSSMINDTDGDGDMDGDDNRNGECDTGEACRTCPNPAFAYTQHCLTARSVDIALTGRLVADHAVTQTINEHVRIRNDKYQ